MKAKQQIKSTKNSNKIKHALKRITNIVDKTDKKFSQLNDEDDNTSHSNIYKEMKQSKCFT